MSPITHLLAGWSLADVTGLRGRDQTLVTWCGVVPDLDGLGAVVDKANELLGRPDSWYFGQYHHALLHGLFAAIAIPLVVSLLAANKLRTFLVGVAAVHLHYLCDIVGSRGPGTDVSEQLTIQWSGQWPLNAWPNIALTLLLIGYGFYRAIDGGYSAVGVFSANADRGFVDTVRTRWASLRGFA